jgi:peptidoglycan/LPS O-acetylase OafA/YrhL
VPGWRVAFAVQGPSRPPEKPATSGLVAHLDTVKADRTPDLVEIVGWSADLEAPASTGLDALDVSVDGVRVCDAKTGINRGDVARAVGEQFRYTGWSCLFDARSWTAGPHELTLTAHAPNGDSDRFFLGAIFDGRRAWPWDAPWRAIIITAAVDFFFIISGFLITTILATTRERPDFLRRFYLRRAVRILPLAWLVIAICEYLYPVPWGWVVPYLLFVNNYVDVWQGQQMVAAVVMWSLAIEEQFYVVFPLVCLVVSKQRWWLVVAGVVVGSWTWSLLARPDMTAALYPPGSLTHLKAYVIGFGAWLALVRQGLVPRPRLCLAVLAVWLVIVTAMGGEMGYLEVPAYALMTGMVWLAATDRWALSSIGLRYFGLRCYGLYLVHVLVYTVLRPLIPSITLPVYLFVAFGVAVLLAHLSYRFFEQPLIRWGHRRLAISGGPVHDQREFAGPQRGQDVPDHGLKLGQRAGLDAGDRLLGHGRAGIERQSGPVNLHARNTVDRDEQRLRDAAL